MEALDIDNKIPTLKESQNQSSVKTEKKYAQKPLFDVTPYENTATKNLLGEVIERSCDGEPQ